MRRNKQGATRFLRMKVVLVLNLAVLGMVGWAFWGEFSRGRELQGEIDQLKSAATALEDKNVELTALRERLNSDGQVEREARMKLNLMRPGEQVVVIKDLGPLPHETEDGTNEERPPPADATASNAVKWLRYFMRDTAQDIH